MTISRCVIPPSMTFLLIGFKTIYPNIYLESTGLSKSKHVWSRRTSQMGENLKKKTKTKQKEFGARIIQN